MSDELLRTDFDPADRELCPDGACVGVIGSDGRCRECGKKAPGGAPGATPAQAEKIEAAAPPVAPRVVEGDSFDPSQRELCPDGACIGVIGPDGRCKECGAPSPGGAPADPERTEEIREAGGTDTPSIADDAPPRDTAAPDDDDFDPGRREVCPDGSCIGIIGPDGRCVECGARLDDTSETP